MTRSNLNLIKVETKFGFRYKMMKLLLITALLPLITTASQCTKRGIYLECSNLSVDDLIRQYTNEETLKLTNLTGISSWDSANLAPVNTIILNDAKLTSEGFRDLVRLPHLSTLEISKLDILKNITSDDFPVGTNLRRLTIKQCNQCIIKLNLPFLSEVDLSENDFAEDPIVTGKDLQFLNLSSTSFSDYKSSGSLQELDLSRNGIIGKFERISGSFPELEKLFLNNNNITEFYASLESLTILNLSENQIQKINNSSFELLPQLTTLYLSGNEITTMIQPFDSTPLLKFLDLSKNQLKALNSTWFDKTKELEILKVSDNFLEVLPTLTTMLLNLHHVDLSSNKLVSLNADFFRKVPELAFLDVSNNKLTKIDNVTPFLGNLNRLLISSNSLVVGKTTFAPMREINYLDASDNGLKITLSVFGKNSALRHLYLDSNLITDLCDGESAPADIEYLFLKNNQVRDKHLVL